MKTEQEPQVRQGTEALETAHGETKEERLAWEASKALADAMKAGQRFAAMIERLRIGKHGPYLGESHAFQLFALLQDIQQAILLLGDDGKTIERLKGTAGCNRGDAEP